MNNKYFLGFFLFLCAQLLIAQTPKRMTSAEIFEGIQKAQFLGSVLYVAAHPDDENTRMISYLSNHVKAETAYLSLTRGDGGQNLIGNELAELLGVIRTQELLAARRIDGGQQFFSRANDFGYSKHPDETLKMWQRDEVLSDVVWTVRKFQPDVIINRFDHDSAGKTHGHHTSSAVLSMEAWDLVGDKNAYSSQLKYVQPWQPRRLFMNTSWWFYGSREKFAEADKSDMVDVDAGIFLPMKGMSNGEIAALSRSQHRCQGMGRALNRGTEREYLKLYKGDMPKNQNDIFEGINTTWSRVKGGAAIGKLLAEVEREYNFAQPQKSVPKLMQAYGLIRQLPDGRWKNSKKAELEDIITACQGLYAETLANDYSATPGELIDVSAEIVSASGETVLEKVVYLPNQMDTVLNSTLAQNEPLKFSKQITIPKDAQYTSPYWLTEAHELGMYTVRDQQMRGLPETPRLLQVEYHLKINGQPLVWKRDVVHKKVEPNFGEIFRPFEVLPPVFVGVDSEVYIFGNKDSKPVRVTVIAGQNDLKGTLRLDVPAGWTVKPATADLNLAQKGEKQNFEFELLPPTAQSEGIIKPVVSLNGKTYSKERVLIEYDHIPTQTVLKDAGSKVVKIDLRREGDKIGYIMGAGDKIPENLQEIGYQVDLLEDDDITAENLTQYDAIITGIRAYNTRERMKFHQPKLLEYVKGGGTLIVQYNTTWRMPFPKEQIAPYSLTLSRDRVTVEEAEVRFLAPKHQVLNFPNKITQDDFKGWVQERGLYFPNEWDEERFTAILSSNDPGEEPRNGGLLIAPYGKGNYVYTGYSWFRELPAGVPGAYRLFANMIGLGSVKRP